MFLCRHCTGTTVNLSSPDLPCNSPNAVTTCCQEYIHLILIMSKTKVHFFIIDINFTVCTEISLSETGQGFDEVWRSMMNETQSQGRECLYVLGTSVSHLWSGNNGEERVHPRIWLNWSTGIRTMSTWWQMFSASCWREVNEMSTCVSVSIRNWEKECSETKLRV